MRIIAGKHKGRILSSFKGDAVRPTADRAKEALFNIFKDEIAGSNFLDLFCGSGNVGIEALSRGAVVTMCDNSKESIALTKKNLALIKEDCRVILCDALDFLRTTSERFDFIFIDPPYRDEVGLKALKLVAERGLLTDRGTVIYERDEVVDEQIEGLSFISSRKYGKGIFNIYKKAYSL